MQKVTKLLMKKYVDFCSKHIFLFSTSANSCDHDLPYKFEIDLTNNCHNRCKFCYYANLLEASKTVPDVNRIVDSVKEELIRLDSIAISRNINNYKPALYVLGGEPLLYIQELYDILLEIGELFSCVKIISSMPFTVVKQYDLFKKLLLIPTVKISIDFSVLAFDENIANKIRCVEGRQLYINDTLHKMLKDKDLQNVPIILRVVLDPDIYKTSKDIDDVIDGFSSLCSDCEHKFFNIRFTELDDEPVDVYKLFKLDKQLKSAYSFGCGYAITNRSLPIILKRKCFRECPEKRRPESFGDVLKVLYKNFRIRLNDNKPYWEPMPIIKYNGEKTNFRKERDIVHKICRIRR